MTTPDRILRRVPRRHVAAHGARAAQGRRAGRGRSRSMGRTGHGADVAHAATEEGSAGRGGSGVIHHCDWRDLLAHVPECDALIVDAPYSDVTHNGHGTLDRHGTGLPPTYDGGRRRELNYSHWSPDDVSAFVSAWSPRTRGWFVTITDHVLAPAWNDALEAIGRYVFSPLAYVAPGSRVRLSGDGPAQWSCWIVVARPKSRTFQRWGTLPGAYVLPPGEGGKLPVVGGKALWLMARLVEDYSRAGDLVVDPCCGAGTTLVAAALTNRRAVGGDISAEHIDIARRWMANPTRPAPRTDRADPAQPSLFGAA